MTREIKFRGREVDTGYWIFGSLCQTAHDSTIMNWNSILYSQVVIEPETIGQFTGLKDKNGVEIYEGDILGIVGNKGSYYGAMEWDEGANGWKQFAPLNRFEVIGNIYQNPELLK